MPVRQRRSIEVQEANSTIHNFLQQRNNIRTDDAAYLDVACRRYIAAIQETDLIDKFCDFWEACEFLSKNLQGKGLGTPVARISKILSDHTKKKKTDLDKLVVNPLYKIRSDIVHNAIENPDKIDMNLPLLEDVVCELIKSRLGLPYTGSFAIDNTFNPGSVE
jgi:hypothetical protein